MSGIKVIFGGGGLRPERGFPDGNAVREALDVLEANGIDTIDTARLYGPSETLLGRPKPPRDSSSIPRSRADSSRAHSQRML